MCCPWFKKFCFCLPLKWGVICVAILDIFYSALEIIVLYLYSSDNEDLGLNENTDALLETYKIASDIVMIIVSVVLLAGACRQKAVYLTPYLVIAMAYIAWMIIFLLAKVINEVNVEYFIAQWVFLCYHVCAWWLAQSYYVELMLETDPAYNKF